MADNRQEGTPNKRQEGTPDAIAKGFRLAIGLLLLFLVAGLAAAVLSEPLWGEGLRPQVRLHLAASGVSHPVTAVLLNFRGYDTLLELVVLLLALMAVWSLAPIPLMETSPPGIVLEGLTRLFAPIMILVAGYLLWIGAKAPGGAFQAGAILGGAGVLLQLDGWRLPAAGIPLRLMLSVAVLLFIAVALLTAIATRGILSYPPDLAGGLILAIETAATLSIAATLAALFPLTRP